MRRRTCKTCKTKFKTLEGRVQHEKRGQDKNDFDKVVLKNQNKYFIFIKSKEITRNHEYLYRLNQVNSRHFQGNVKDDVLKENSYKMPSGEIQKKLENKYLSSLDALEFNKFKKYLERIRCDKNFIQELKNNI